MNETLEETLRLAKTADRQRYTDKFLDYFSKLSTNTPYQTRVNQSITYLYKEIIKDYSKGENK